MTARERIEERRRKRRRARIRRKIICCITLGAVSLSTAGAAWDASAKEITLTHINQFSGASTSTVIKTRQATVGDFLEENEIVLMDNDRLNMDNNSEIRDKSEIVITRGRSVTVVTADGSRELSVTEPTVGEALRGAGIEIGESDKVSPSESAPITGGMTITIRRITTQNDFTTEPIAHGTKTIETPELKKGDQRVEEGSDGVLQKDYVITYEDGAEVSRECVRETITVAVKDTIIYVGTAEEQAAPKSEAISASKTVSDDSSKTINGKKYTSKITVTATAYSTSPSENGGWSSTAMGTRLRKGVIAVDPSVIPLGSKVYVAAADGSWSYGTAIAEDTGGAIKGQKVDLCFPTASECRSFGRRTAVVYILE